MEEPQPLTDKQETEAARREENQKINLKLL